MCFTDPQGLGNLCLKLYQLDARNKTLSGCMDVSPRVAGRELSRIRLGCFRHANGTSFMERKVASVLTNKKKTTYTHDVNPNAKEEDSSFFADYGKGIVYSTYSSIIETLKKMNLEELTGNFNPVKFATNFFSSFFSPVSWQSRGLHPSQEMSGKEWERLTKKSFE